MRDGRRDELSLVVVAKEEEKQQQQQQQQNTDCRVYIENGILIAEDYRVSSRGCETNLANKLLISVPSAPEFKHFKIDSKAFKG